jgi:hypothetical protein
MVDLKDHASTRANMCRDCHCSEFKASLWNAHKCETCFHSDDVHVGKLVTAQLQSPRLNELIAKVQNNQVDIAINRLLSDTLAAIGLSREQVDATEAVLAAKLSVCAPTASNATLRTLAQFVPRITRFADSQIELGKLVRCQAAARGCIVRRRFARLSAEERVMLGSTVGLFRDLCHSEQNYISDMNCIIDDVSMYGVKRGGAHCVWRQTVFATIATRNQIEKLICTASTACYCLLVH